MENSDILINWYIDRIDHLLLQYEYSDRSIPRHEFVKMTQSELELFDRSRIVPENIKLYLHMIYGIPEFK